PHPGVRLPAAASGATAPRRSQQADARQSHAGRPQPEWMELLMVATPSAPRDKVAAAPAASARAPVLLALPVQQPACPVPMAGLSAGAAAANPAAPRP